MDIEAVKDFIRRMSFSMKPTVVIKSGDLFIVKWLWRKDGKPVDKEEDADGGVIHQYSKSGILVMEAMV